MLEKLLKGKQIISVVCNQFGDTGKGKIVDYFSEWADVIARGTGGDNAGHTVVVNGVEKIFHIIPSGISYDSMGKINIIGNGTVLNIKVLDKELNELDKNNMTYKNLRISKDANVIMPYHIQQDIAKNKSQCAGGIGSTGRGIGPCYTDKVARRGITILDLFDRDVLAKKIEDIKPFYEGIIINKDTGEKIVIDTEKIISELGPYSNRIKPFVRDTVSEIHNLVRQKKKILLEGAQGLLLSIEHGTYPYVTSSDCSLNGTASGVGLSANQVDLPFGIIKFPFMSRVGGGPFPTEFGGEKSEQYCAEEKDIFYEVKTYLGMNLDLEEIKKLKGECNFQEVKKLKKQAYEYIKQNNTKVLEMINHGDQFIQGIGVRLIAGEYGATTGRPRRVGWTDAVMGKYAVGINGPLMILTKPDCLSGINNFDISYGYGYTSLSDNFKKDEKYLRNVKTVLRSYEGYEDISEIKKFRKLPSSLKEAIEDFEYFTGGCVKIVSVGAERNQTIIR